MSDELPPLDDARKKLAESAVPIVAKVAAFVAAEYRNLVEKADLVAAGNEAAVKLARGFDTSIPPPFSTVVKSRAEKAMLDVVRARARDYARLAGIEAAVASSLGEEVDAFSMNDTAADEKRQLFALVDRAAAAGALAAIGLGEATRAASERHDETLEERERAEERVRLVAAMRQEFGQENMRLLELVMVEGVPREAVAEMLGVSASTLYRRIKELRARVVGWMRRRGVGA